MKTNKKRIAVDCNCGCNIVTFDSYPKHEYAPNRIDPETIIISNYWLGFYANQNSILGIVKGRLKAIWYILRGKEYNLYDISIEGEEDIQKFKKEMQEFLDGIGN